MSTGTGTLPKLDFKKAMLGGIITVCVIGALSLLTNAFRGGFVGTWMVVYIVLASLLSLFVTLYILGPHPFEQMKCVAGNAECISDAQCCGNDLYCKGLEDADKGICRSRTCGKAGTDCGPDSLSSCCEGLECNSDNKCITCVKENATCNADSICCTGLGCKDGKCVKCIPVNSFCSDSKPCCSLSTCIKEPGSNQGTCKECRAIGGPCEDDAHCCGTGVCDVQQGWTCQPPSSG